MASYGVSVQLKFLWIFIIALIAALALYLPYPYGLAKVGDQGTVIVPFYGLAHIGYFYIPVAIFIIIATSNAVNIADGMDGLAAWLWCCPSRPMALSRLLPRRA